MSGPWPVLTRFPLSARCLCTAFFLVAGLGFIFAELEIFDRHHRSGEWLISMGDIMQDYHGDPKRSLLEQKITDGGSMAIYVASNPAGRDLLLDWVKRGAPAEGYNDAAKILNQQGCAGCHRAGGQASFAPFDSYEHVKGTFTQHGGGISFSHLVMSSHVHMLAIPFIFAFTGLMVVFSSLAERAKAVLVALPFAAIVLDVGSWWATKYVCPYFAFTIVLGGAAYAFLFLIQFLVVMNDLWLEPRPPFNAEETKRG